MTQTLQRPAEGNLDADMQRLMDALVKDLVAAQAVVGSGPDGGTRDVPAPVPPSVPSTSAADGQPEAERFFGGLVKVICTKVIPKVAPLVLDLLQNRRRELGLPEERDAASVERDLGAILNALFPKLLEAVPTIIAAVSGQPAPRGTEQENERFLPFLAALVPALISAVPTIINAFNGNRGVVTPEPSIADPAVVDRFIGPLLAGVLPQLLQAAPSILSSIFGGGRDIGDNEPAWG